jgi:hypothetical protein
VKQNNNKTKSQAQDAWITNEQKRKVMIHSNINGLSLLIAASRRTLRRYSAALLLAAFLASLDTARADLFSFNIIGGPTAINILPDGDEETLRLTGSGGFDTLAGTASGSGKFVFKNAEEPLGPNFRGVWVVTGFDSFDADGGPRPQLQGGTLKVNITMTFDNGIYVSDGTLTVVCPFDGTAFDEAGDGIEVYVALVGETFTTPYGGAPGSTVFRIIKP